MALIPEEALLDLVLNEPLPAARLIEVFAELSPIRLSRDLLDDIRLELGLTPGSFAAALGALQKAGTLEAEGDGYRITAPRETCLTHAALLRGAVYARYRHKDRNSVEITLSTPAHPSRLVELLSPQTFSWSGLYHTTDSLAALVQAAQQRFVIASPYVDEEGLRWVEALCRHSRVGVKRTLLVRGIDDESVCALQRWSERLAGLNVTVVQYCIPRSGSGYESFHAKMLLADSDSAYIGSANMNRPSRGYSLECGVVVRGPGARPVATLIEAMMGLSRPWSPWGREPE